MIWLPALALVLLASAAHAQTAVQQSGPVVNNSAAMWATDHHVRQAAGAAGDVAGKMITGGLSAVGNVCSFTNTTDQNGIALCLDAAGGRFLYNGVGYPLTAGGGSVIGPISTTIDHVALWNNTTGSLLKGSTSIGLTGLTVTDNRTAAITTGGAWGSLFTSDGSVPTGIVGNALYDTLAGIVNVKPGTTLVNVNGVSGYAWNNNPAGGAAGNGVGLYGHGFNEVAGAWSWGINASATSRIGVGGGHLYAAEFDVNANNAGDNVIGALIAGGGPVQPASSLGISIGPLSLPTPSIKWDYGIHIQPGATTNAIGILPAEKTAFPSNSQTIVFQSRDGAGAPVNYYLASTPTSLSLISDQANPFLELQASLALGGVGRVISINSRALLATTGNAASVAYDPALTSAAIGHAAMPLTLRGNSVIVASMPTSAGAGGLTVCVDTAGALYKKASCP